MTKRFFKLIYVIALLGIIISLPIYVLSAVQFDKIVISSYKVKCLSNNEYIVLQGDNSPTIIDENYLNSKENKQYVEKQLNFYCKYYNEIQPFIVEYIEADKDNVSFTEIRKINIKFSTFQEPLMERVNAYPPLYKLEEVSTETNWYEVSGPIIDGLLIAILAFVILQAIRICYMYVVYNEIVWHPFKYKSKNNE